MADSFNSSNNSLCSEFDTYRYVIVAAVSSGSAMVSALCCIFVIGLVFLLKKQQFFLQRIILYHCLASLFRAVATILRLHRLGYNFQNETPAQGTICVLTGFINQVSQWCLAIDYAVITFILLMTAVFRKNVARLEGLYIALIFILPLTFNWIPFINNSYGNFGPWCWIRTINYDCSYFHLGFIFQQVLWSTPSIILMITLVIIYSISIAYIAKEKCSRKKEEVAVEDSEGERLKRELHNEAWRPIFFLPLGIVIITIFPLVRFIYSLVYAGNPSFTLWILTTIFAPLQGGYIALVYVLDPATLKRITYSNVRASLKRRATVSEYSIECNGLSDSAVVDDCTPHTSYRLYPKI